MNNVNVGQKISCTETLQLIVKQKGVDTEGGGDSSRPASLKGLWSKPVTRGCSGQDHAVQTGEEGQEGVTTGTAAQHVFISFWEHTPA